MSDALTVRTYKTIAKRVMTEDVDTTIGRLTATHERHMQILEDALKEAKPGTKTFLDYVRILEDMENRFTELMQSLGVLPKNLGNSTVTKYEFTSSMGLMPEDERNKRSVDMFTAPARTIEGEIVE
jgi:rubrerythrin